MRYKIIQWATGSMGKTCLRAIIDHPHMELVGVYVYSDKKVGLDAGNIAHRPATGVLATNNIDEILALEADVIFHTAQIEAPYDTHNQAICRLLASGKNVLSINGHSYPQYWPGTYTKALVDACQQGQSTLMGGGLNPGFITDKIAAVASSICLDVEHIEVTEIIDCCVMQSPGYVFDMLGFGSRCDKLNPNNPDWPPAQILNGMYSEVVAHLVDRLGHTLDRIETDHVVYPATQDINMSAGLIKQGTASHTHWRWHGVVNGKKLITQSIHWIMETAHLNNPDYSLWTVQINGLPSVTISIDLSLPDDHRYKTTPEQYGVAGSLINSVATLVSAPPGFRDIILEDVYRAS
jgi:hypothetical protein